MNKKIFVILFFIFSVFIFMGAVCANNITEDANALSAVDDGDLSIAVDDEDVFNANGKDSSFKDLNTTINSGNDVVEITEDYTFNDESDGDFVEGIQIDWDNLVINGNNHTIDANNKARFFNITGYNIVINDLIFKNGYGSAIVDYGSLKTSNVEFNNCSSDGGAALSVVEAQYLSENDRFISNNAIEGAIYSDGGNVTVNKGVFDGNSADRGSSIFALDSIVAVNDSLFSNNHNNWSSIYLDRSLLNVSGTTFANSTSKYATAIYSEDGLTEIKKSRFVNLIANITAGALAFKSDSDVLIDGCEFINSMSNKNGGAIFIDIFTLYDKQQGDVLINNTVFNECLSGFGGAFLQLGGNLLIANSNFTGNYAEFNGGAIYLSSTESIIVNCSFADNIVMTYEGYPTYGGAIFCDYSDLTAHDSQFINNSASEGSALYMHDAVYDLDNLEFNGNENAVYSLFDKGTRSNLKGKDNISDDDFGNTVYYDVISADGMRIVLLNNTINVTTMPARYDLREENLVTPVKDQGHMGACWVFGSLAALESAVLKAMNYTADFSENNMQNSMLQYSQVGRLSAFEGGINLDAIAYLVSWLGAFPKDYDSYDELGKISPYMTTGEDIHVQDIIIMPHTPGNDESIRNVKELIYKYGAIGGYLLSKSSQEDGNPTGYYNENTSAEYVPDHVISNHAVCVVGWDDDYSAGNFLITPPGDGAWIVKNSWGTDWGDEGYFYVSYYDQTLCAFPDKWSESFIAFVFENDLPYNNNYQHDFSGFNSFYSEDSNKIFYLNTFEANEDDLVAAVGTYFDRQGVEYTVDIIVNDEIVYRQSGISPFIGYHTIKLDKYVSIKKGDNFSVSMMSNAMPFGAKMRAHQKNVSYYSVDGKNWGNLIEMDLVACLKAYTLPNVIITENIKEYYSDNKPFVVNVSQSNVSVSVSINNVTITNVSDENGIAIFELPLLDPDVYIITTVCDGISIINTVTVLDTIDVPREITVGCNAKVDAEVVYYDNEGNVVSVATFPIINQIGTYSANFTNCLTNQTVTSTIKVVSRFSGNKNINMYYYDGSKYSFKVYGDDGKLVGKDKSVTVKIGKKVYKVKTNANGVATLKIPKEITPGTYTISATYAGQTVKNTLKVKKTLSSKKVTVKKTAKKLVLKATLKNGKKPVKGKWITFKFNGKTYKAKTNSKGVAQKILKKKVIKKLKKGKTFTVKVIYLKETIKSSVKVK